MNAIKPDEYALILRSDFATFMERAFYEINPGKQLLLAPYLELICSKLEACRRGEIKRLAICLPPRYLKSHCVSVAFVAWLLGHRPNARIICASYAQDLANKHALECRTLMQSPLYKHLFRTRLSPDKHAVDDFMTTVKGYRMAASVTGGVTGRGADFIIIDDALKPQDALSETERTKLNRWYDNTLLSRLDDKSRGCIIIVMQRLHQDDLVGHVLEQGGWEVLSLPAIADHEEEFRIESPLGHSIFKRGLGTALHPERESVDDLSRLRQTMGEYDFAAQYQQNPSPQGGAMVKKEWLKYYVPEERPAQFGRIVQSWDTANKAGELNDFSVCTTWGEKDKHYYLLHVYRKRLAYPDLKRAVKDQAQIHRPSAIVIEDKASGTQLIQELTQEGLSGITRYEPPACDKIMRLHGQTAVFENGLVLIPKEAHWLQDYLQELTTFPGSKHDDQVDSTTQALAWMRKPMAGWGIFEYYRQLAEKAGKG
jgi:predicted phage terminase large subunit-like protein